MSDHLNRDQFRRATRSTHDLTGGEVELTYHPGRGEEPETVQAWAWEDTRPLVSGRHSDGDWEEGVCSLVREHADAQGPGTHRYQLQTRDAQGRTRGVTWARVTIRRSRRSAEEATEDLDGSTGAWVAHMQRASAEAQARADKMVESMMQQQERTMRMLDSLMERIERQSRVEREEREALEAALAEVQQEQASPASETWAQLVTAVGPVLASSLADRLAPLLEPMAKEVLGGMLGEGSAPLDPAPGGE